jgi:hypothetical protein
MGNTVVRISLARVDVWWSPTERSLVVVVTFELTEVAVETPRLQEEEFVIDENFFDEEYLEWLRGLPDAE